MCVRVCGEEGMFVCFRARIRVWKYFNKSSAVYTAPDKYKYNAGLSTARVLYGWMYYRQRRARTKSKEGDGSRDSRCV